MTVWANSHAELSHEIGGSLILREGQKNTKASREGARESERKGQRRNEREKNGVGENGVASQPFFFLAKRNRVMERARAERAAAKLRKGLRDQRAQVGRSHRARAWKRGEGRPRRESAQRGKTKSRGESERRD